MSTLKPNSQFYVFLANPRMQQSCNNHVTALHTVSRLTFALLERIQ